MSGINIKYSIHAIPQKDEQGRTTYQVRQDTRGTIGTKDLEAELVRYQLPNNFSLDGAIEWLQKQLIAQMSFNRRVHLNGLGTFSLNIGLKPKYDEDGTKHRRIVTDPKEITGNDLEVTGISFVPDKELLQNTKGRIVHFEHSAPQGSVGHSVEYTEEQMRQSLIEWFSEHDYLTRPLMIKCWHVTEYRATKWLQLFTTGDDSLLERRRQAGTSFYYLRRTSA